MGEECVGAPAGSGRGRADAAEKEETVSFERMRLRVGETLRLTPDDPGAPPAHFCVRYIGALHGKSLITSLPIEGEKGLWMPPDGRYILRALSGTHVYAFTSQVMVARATPYPHVHFQYPATVQARRVRDSLRVGMRQAIEIADGEGRTLPGTLLDISMHGARIELAAPPAGDRLRLVLPISADDTPSQLNLPARVRNREEGDTHGRKGLPRLGMQFGKLDKQESLLLHYFINRAIVQSGAELL